ncbi:formylglycine-generating enzyme family protein [Neogemmobacter tilapiae]|uniref:Protein 3-oxoalanine-generating enzyme family protein n=1 Tax=Neogemmobacter tilapiae TaxID=875041 RepID=A0A918TGB3_9RHOB|nr:formylglycine-generating enzyme family protein [Gemmobacter tilapiae]GHC46372.1 protein 3-oxoalanine-generating enzyme family protein [Gemmobacter tilapiae]
MSKTKVAILGSIFLFCAPQSFAEPLDVFRDCDVCPEMVELPLGEFMMGAPDGEFRRRLAGDGTYYSGNPENPYKKEDEGPQHKVIIDIPIAMGRNEVTYDEWMVCVADGGCNGYAPSKIMLQSGPNPIEVELGGSFPVIRVSYDDALTYVEWLNKKTGSNGYRLPTEAEWEYAARARTTTPFAQGETVTPQQANFSKQLTQVVMLEDRPDLLERGMPVPVGELDAANNWGLRHMSGNVMEVTMSCYTERLLNLKLSSEWLTTIEKSCRRTLRGGDFASPVDILRVAWRAPTDADSRVKYVGFRVIKELNAGGY